MRLLFWFQVKAVALVTVEDGSEVADAADTEEFKNTSFDTKKIFCCI
jgi:hypothetical protein